MHLEPIVVYVHSHLFALFLAQGAGGGGLRFQQDAGVVWRITGARVACTMPTQNLGQGWQAGYAVVD
jgi:hypothetical protein